MKLTKILNHGKRFWWGKGFGHKPRINTDHFYYKMQWNAKRRRPLEIVEQTLPEDVIPIDPNKYLKSELNKEYSEFKQFILPWPYSKRPVKGSTEDPNYKETAALVYQRNKRLIEPVNLPLHFTNSILEKDLPDSVLLFNEKIKIEENFVDLFKRKVNWCLESDSFLRKLPLQREYPYLDQRPPRVWGITVNRKEISLLQTFYEIVNSWTSRNFGFNSDVVLQRVSYPYCNLPIERDNKFVLLDLECDFVTLLSPSKSDSSIHMKQFDNNFSANTSRKPLQSIRPLSWEVAFDSKNFYKSDIEFQIPNNSSIQTIFLSNNNVRLLNPEDYQGRSIMFCYGYAVQQAKLKYGTNDISKITLEKPITIQCVYTSPKDFKVGYVLFQLNTLDFENDNIRNQVWFSHPKSILDDTKDVIADLITVQSHGVYDNKFM